MPKFTRNKELRSSFKKLYGGKSAELNETRPCTYEELIQYYYHLRSSSNCGVKQTIRTMSAKVRGIWFKISSQLPVIADKSIENKVARLIEAVNKVNSHRTSNTIQLDEKLHQIFDIARCHCNLDSHPCGHSSVKCKKENCSDDHIVCSCPTDSKVPVEERAYLRDQRSRNGGVGMYQMSTLIAKKPLKEKKLAPQLTHTTDEMEQSSSSEPSAEVSVDSF